MHDEKAEWIWGVLAETETADLATWPRRAARAPHAKILYRGKNNPDLRTGR
jgi:hypothetical protein